MKLTKLTYTGRKLYRDKVMGTVWMPGDTNPVTDKAAEKLLRFAEFARADAKQAKPKQAEKVEQDDDAMLTPEQQAEADAQAAALLQAQQAEKVEQDEQAARESMLLTVDSMDKGALEEYARKYEVELDKRRSLDTLRAEVANLIEQFGAR